MLTAKAGDPEWIFKDTNTVCQVDGKLLISERVLEVKYIIAFTNQNVKGTWCRLPCLSSEARVQRRRVDDQNPHFRGDKQNPVLPDPSLSASEGSCNLLGSKVKSAAVSFYHPLTPCPFLVSLDTPEGLIFFSVHFSSFSPPPVRTRRNLSQRHYFQKNKSYISHLKKKHTFLKEKFK